MHIPDETQLKRAIVEDEIVEFLLSRYPDFVMHGGTAVWRCYGGNRFSRDVDFYSNLAPSEERRFQKNLHKLLIAGGYPIREEKYNRKTKTLHVIFKGAGTTGKLDITFMKANGIAVDYLRVDGSKRIIYALSPEAILSEKIDAYSNKYEVQTHEIQDLYDMVVLKDRISNPSKEVHKKVMDFIARIKHDPPKGEKRLRQLLLSGVAPSFVEMIDMLERWPNDFGK